MANKRAGRDVSNGIIWDAERECFVIKVGDGVAPIDYREVDGSPVTSKEK